MFAYIIIILQFYELFAWRDGLYFQYLAISNMFAEKLLYVFCLSQIQTPSVPVPCWACCVRLVVTKQKKDRKFCFTSYSRKNWTYKIKSLSILFLTAFTYTKSSLSQTVTPPTTCSLLSLLYFHGPCGVFSPKMRKQPRERAWHHRERRWVPRASEAQEPALPVTSMTMTVFQEDSKLMQVK